MNREAIIRMAEEAGAMPVRGEPKQLAIVTNLMIERFAALVAAAEREACVELIDEMHDSGKDVCLPLIKASRAIRARGNGDGK